MRSAQTNKGASFNLGSDIPVSNPEKKDLNLLLENLLKNKKQFSKYETFARKELFILTQGKFARHYTAKDILQNIFRKISDKTYHWNLEKYSFKTFMLLRIRTEVEHLVEREIKFFPVDIKSFESDWDPEYDDAIGKDKHLTTEEFILEPEFTSPDIKEETEFDLTDLMEMALDLFKDSEIEFYVLDGIFKNQKPREIAKDLGLTNQEVRNAKMRIRRTLITYCQKKKHYKLLKVLLKPVKKNNRKGKGS
jgi:DNA-directed RNA polymerase specialized sigma24 family protein